MMENVIDTESDVAFAGDLSKSASYDQIIIDDQHDELESFARKIPSKIINFCINSFLQ